MKKAVEHKVISRSIKIHFEEDLEKNLSEGWRIKGNIVTASSGSSITYSILLYRKMKIVDRVKKFLKL